MNKLWALSTFLPTNIRPDDEWKGYLELSKFYLTLLKTQVLNLIYMEAVNSKKIN